ncbi:MAG: hypothetical protein ACI8WB_004929 [Phenylobacterium sp.]
MYIKSLAIIFFFSALLNANELEQSQLPFLSGAVYTMMTDVGYCGYQYAELKINADKIHADLKRLTVKIENYYISKDALSKFESIKKSSITSAGRKLMQTHANGGISLTKCEAILFNASPEHLPSKLKAIVDNL